MRNRQKLTASQDFEYTPYVFKNTYKGYIVTPKKQTSNCKTLPDVFRMGKAWVKDCKDLKLDLQKINSLIHQFYNNDTRLICIDKQKTDNNKVQQDDVSENVNDHYVINDNDSGKKMIQLIY